MDEDAVQSYIDHAQATIEAAPQMDEANTKAAVLRDFLDLLDWTIPDNTQLEYSVKAFGKTYKVDYALILDGTPVAFLEAKGVDTTLTEKHREQLSAYLKNEDVNLGILTNGEEYEFYRREVIDSKVSIDTLGKTTLQHLPDRITTLSAFTTDAIQTNESGKILNRIKDLREARVTLEQEKDPISVEVADIFAERVSENITSQAESQAKEMIDRVIADIDSEIEGDNSVSGGDRIQESSTERDPSLDQNAITGTISRSEIQGKDQDTIAVFPSKKSGMGFLKENNAWGFVNIGKSPEYVAIYVSEDVQQVKYIGKVERVVNAPEAELARPVEEYSESGSDEAQAGFDPDQKVIVFEDNGLYELVDPVQFENEYPRSLRYVTLGDLRTAETTDDLF